MRQLDYVESAIVESKISVRYRDYDIIRQLAKTGKVKMAWSLAETCNQPFFAQDVLEWSSLQIRLAYWLSFYSNISGAYERPPSRVVDNDALLDKWVESKNKESEDDAENNWSKNSSKVSKSAMDHDEVYTLD